MTIRKPANATQATQPDVPRAPAAGAVEIRPPPVAASGSRDELVGSGSGGVMGGAGLPPWSRRGSPDRPQAPSPSSSHQGLGFLAVHGDGVDHKNVEGDDDQRPERVSGD